MNIFKSCYQYVKQFLIEVEWNEEATFAAGKQNLLRKPGLYFLSNKI